MLVCSVLVNILLQGLFAIICMSELANGDGVFHKHAVDEARKWRLTEAHSVNTMNKVSWTSIATRVCEADSTLVMGLAPLWQHGTIAPRASQKNKKQMFGTMPKSKS